MTRNPGLSLIGRQSEYYGDMAMFRMQAQQAGGLHTPHGHSVVHEYHVELATAQLHGCFGAIAHIGGVVTCLTQMSVQ